LFGDLPPSGFPFRFSTSRAISSRSTIFSFLESHLSSEFLWCLRICCWTSFISIVLVVCVCLSEARSLLVYWLNILWCGCKLAVCYYYQYDFGYSTHPQANFNWKKYFLF